MALCRFEIHIRELGKDPRGSGENVLRGNVPGLCAVFGRTVEDVLARAPRAIRLAARAKTKRGSSIDLAKQNAEDGRSRVEVVDVEI